MTMLCERNKQYPKQQIIYYSKQRSKTQEGGQFGPRIVRPPCVIYFFLLAYDQKLLQVHIIQKLIKNTKNDKLFFYKNIVLAKFRFAQFANAHNNQNTWMQKNITLSPCVQSQFPYTLPQHFTYAQCHFAQQVLQCFYNNIGIPHGLGDYLDD
eukprot:TRINITY_DN1669_c0_g1_i3.p2 TRINITY_DN1669_c0_g1~~TRINITY_DN1669_c0_g1_i3.p2  ORF type:complete len:153 (+),score=3.62 TRINITY_DN1669_c0_g1_i3:819-1277(+)